MQSTGTLKGNGASSVHFQQWNQLEGKVGKHSRRAGAGVFSQETSTRTAAPDSGGTGH